MLALQFQADALLMRVQALRQTRTQQLAGLRQRLTPAQSDPKESAPGAPQVRTFGQPKQPSSE